MRREAKQQLVDHVATMVRERVLREAKVDQQVAEIVGRVAMPEPTALTAAVTEWVEAHEVEAWSGGVSEVIRGIAQDIK